MNDRPKEQSPERIAGILFEKLPRFSIGALLIAMIGINFANVISRHVFSAAIFWSEEIMKLLLVWGVYLGAVAVTYKANHLTMDLLSANIPKPYSTVLNSIVFAVLLLVIGYISYFSWQVLQIMNMTGRVSDAAKYPIVVQHAAVFVGLILMGLAAIVRWRTYIRGSANEGNY